MKRRSQWLTGLAVVALAALPSIIGSAIEGNAASPAPKPPGHLFDEDTKASEAMTRVGEKVLEARNPHMSSAEVEELAADPSMWVSPEGRFFAVDKTLGPALSITTTPLPIAAAPQFPLASTFLLESRPGAQKVVFLDFVGGAVTATNWNSQFAAGATITAPAYDTDGNPAAFSDLELAVIQDAWARVAEDFAPFDVNVTTKDPGFDAIDRSSAGDLNFGAQVLITPQPTAFAPCGCNGISFIGVFDDIATHASNQPAWVFPGSGWPAKYIAEAISHETGHNLGLGHDGKGTAVYYGGHGPWGPIMGASYAMPVSQWSKGEYVGATNTEDDLAVMEAHGLAVIADDHGDAAATATVLPAGPVDTTGLIGTAGDVDVFQIDLPAGAAQFIVTPAAVGANLDARLELHDSAGVLIASDDPPVKSISYADAGGLGASISTLVAAGTYTLSVSGVGFGDPSTTGYTNYDSRGRYRLTTGGGVSLSVSKVLPLAGPAAGGTTVTITGSNFQGASAVMFGDAPAISFIVDSAGTKILARAPQHPAGPVNVVVVSPFGSQLIAGTNVFSFLAPTTTKVSPAGGSAGGGTKVIVTGANLKGATSVTFGGVPAASFTVNTSGTRLVAVAPAHVVGTVDVVVTVVGDSSPVSAADQYSFLPPTISSVSPAVGPGAGGTRVTIKGNYFQGTTAVMFGALPATSFTLNATGTRIVAIAPAGVAGLADIGLITPNGVSITSAADQYQYRAPAVSSVTPAAGSSAGRTKVTIRGTYLQGATRVMFGTAPAISLSINSAGTAIVVIAPPHAAGTVDVVVMTPGGSSPTSAAGTYTFI